MGENTFTYCSRIIVVHVHVNVFSKVHPECQNIANRIKPESDSNNTDKHAAESFMLYNNIAKGIRLLDKIAIFVYTGKNSYK